MRSAEGEHGADLAAYLLGAVAVGLVDDVQVADLEDAGLGGLDAVAHAGREQHERGVGEAGDLDLALADADGLDQDHVAAGRVEHPQRLRRRPGQPAEVAAGGHRADVDLAVERVVLHPHPVAEQGAAGERRRRVDGEYADPLAGRAQLGDQRRGGRGLADAGRAGDADDLRVAGVRRQRGHHLAQQRRGVLDQRDQPRDRTGVAVAGTRDEIGDRRGGAPATAEAHAGRACRDQTGQLPERARSGRRPGRRRRTARPRRRRHRGASAPARGAARCGCRTCRPGGRARSRRR